ncbi:archaemetzincin family Zn-dependent metalloprotease [Acidilobus sp.]|jgi:archaemetzincin|uniref:archaemetzincin family Zn-dependent metalloprotease n=1 Tax=Acidilobus sp. TaxID=1872109 RepID=UPI003CFD8A2E
MIELIVQPVGRTRPEDAVFVGSEIAKSFPVRLSAVPSMWSLQPPASAYDWGRMQYRADEVNAWLHRNLEPLLKGKRLALGLVGADAYVPGLNFVFGLADPNLGVATVYTARLESEDRSRYLARLLKESVHEVGHLLGLGHCSNRSCVMSFSNSLEDVDLKSEYFCDDCKLKLRSLHPSD